MTHEALARYVRTNSPRPTVVKLHGDAHLDPKNLRPETNEISAAIAVEFEARLATLEKQREPSRPERQHERSPNAP